MKDFLAKNKIRKIVLFIYDLITLFASYIITLLVTDKINLFTDNFSDKFVFGVISIVFSMLLYCVLRLYNSIWKYAGLNEMIRIVIATLLCFALNIIVFIVTSATDLNFNALPKDFGVFAFMQIAFAIIPRFGLGVYNYFKNGNSNIIINKKTLEMKRVLIVGAGDAGDKIVTEMQVSEHLSMRPMCFIDDDPNKLNTAIKSVMVEGNRTDIARLVEKYAIDLIIIAIPSINKKEMNELINICKETNVAVKVLPGTAELINSNNLIGSIRDVEITDLLGRDQVQVDLNEVMGYIEGKVVMITGGGGSIGSELCRQVASHSPKQLIIFDIYENNAYEIEQELRRKMPELNLLALIGSVRDKGKLEDVFKKYRPNIVFHAAAHKHVPLMETSPNEAIKNNVFGTYNCATLADKYNVSKFILISTDKAVNPTNVMGASKRICEMVIQTMSKKSKNTLFAAVRFGNVLGSNGSVIPLFKKQIQEGGPVTVTHKEITRFFMTIPEAVSLVLQAGAYAKGGEIFVLDMGKPVKIYDLAENLIKLSGFTPNVDIEIKITGLRPGEKLYEELLMDEEGLQKTNNSLIFIGKPIELDEDTFFNKLDSLYESAYSETDKMREIIADLVPTYHPNMK